MKWKRTAAATVVMMLSVAGARAQEAATPAATVKVDPAKSLDAVFTAFEKQLVPLVEAMPEDRYDFAPSAADFKMLKADYTGVRTFRQEVIHLTQSFYFLGASASGVQPDVAKAKAVAETKSKQELVAALKDAVAYVHTQIATITPDNAFNQSGRDPLMTRASAAVYVAAHGYDHYGQLVEYLRMNGIVPPASEGKKLANPDKKN